MPLDAQQRAIVRAKVDELVRLQVEIENASVKTCPECAMPADDWTPGCSHCGDRHRARIRFGYSGAVSSAFALRIKEWAAALSREGSRMENGRRKTVTV